MEVKINREIRNYTESMFFGLSLRQFIFSVLACGVAVGLYFLLRPYVGTETVSWVCILGAAPFAALGFVKYNGMTAEKAIYAWIKSEFLMPKKLVFHSTNVYYELMKPSIEQKQKLFVFHILIHINISPFFPSRPSSQMLNYYSIFRKHLSVNRLNLILCFRFSKMVFLLLFNAWLHQFVINIVE